MKQTGNRLGNLKSTSSFLGKNQSHVFRYRKYDAGDVGGGSVESVGVGNGADVVPF